MNDYDRLLQIEEKADEILKARRGIYLEKKLFMALKQEFPDLSRKEFQDVLKTVLERGYILEHALIRPLPPNKSQKSIKNYDDSAIPGKGVSEAQRISNKRELE